MLLNLISLLSPDLHKIKQKEENQPHFYTDYSLQITVEYLTMVSIKMFKDDNS